MLDISSLQGPDDETDEWTVVPLDHFGAISASTPYLALLKALAAQWGVEVSND